MPFISNKDNSNIAKFTFNMMTDDTSPRHENEDETPNSHQKGARSSRSSFISRIFGKSSSGLLQQQQRQQQQEEEEIQGGGSGGTSGTRQQGGTHQDANDGKNAAYRPPSPISTYAISSHFPPRILTPIQNNKNNTKQGSKAFKRYRGFSTSISSLFLDETIVCPSAAWCGILSSCRTEHLLHVRNQKRKVLMNQDELETKFRGPSRILALCLLSTLVAIVITYVIWGFGSYTTMENQSGQYYNYNNNNNNNNKYYYYDNNYVDNNNNNNNNKDDGNKYYNENANEENNANEYYNGGNANRGLVYDVERHHKNDLYNHRIPNVMRLKDYRNRFWLSVETMAKDVLFQGQHVELERKDHSKQLQQPQRFLYGGGSTNIWNDQNIARNIRSVLWVLFFVVLGTFGRRRRMKTRFAVLKARMEDDKAFYGVGTSSSSSGASIRSIRTRFNKTDMKTTRESKYDGACSHTLCGCYPVDKVEESVEQEPDCVNLGFRTLSKLCCGWCCRLWVQCFSICALAQEAREARLLLPPKDQRVDYLTHQPFEEYYKDVYFLRQKWKSSNDKRYSWKSHFAALSKLSRYILATFISVTLIIIVTERLNPLAFFSWADACVLMMTFIQSFIVLGK
jgi:hypothetical protein